MPRPDRRRPYARIPFLWLEFGAGAEPDAVPGEGPDDAYRQALLAQPLLRMDSRVRHHLCRRRSDGAEHAAEQAARLYREGRADLAADDLQHCAAHAGAVGTV